MTEWHEQDSFWETTAPAMFGARRWGSAPQEVDGVVRLLGLAPGANVLDLCCGVGRHSLELARRGYRVTGVDRTGSYLEQARAKANAEGLQVEFVQADMRGFRHPSTYDAAINLFTSFGYFRDPADDRKVAANLLQSLKPGSKALIDIVGKEVLARIFRERDWRAEDGIIMLEERKLQPGWGWIDNRWILIKGDQRTELTLGHRLYSAAELAALLRDVGFDSVDVYGDLEGAPYDQNAKRLVAVARKG